MKFTAKQCDQIFATIERYGAVEVTPDLGISLTAIRRMLAPIVAKFANSVDALVLKYGGRYEKGKAGNVTLMFYDDKKEKSPENMQDYLGEYRKLSDVISEIDIEKIPVEIQRAQKFLPLDFFIKLELLLE